MKHEEPQGPNLMVSRHGASANALQKCDKCRHLLSCHDFGEAADFWVCEQFITPLGHKMPWSEKNAACGLFERERENEVEMSEPVYVSKPQGLSEPQIARKPSDVSEPLTERKPRGQSEPKLSRKPSDMSEPLTERKPLARSEPNGRSKPRSRSAAEL